MFSVLEAVPVDGRLFLAYPHDPGALSQSFDELQLLDDGGSDLVSRFMQDPYATTFGGFSKVTNFFRGALRPPDSPLHASRGSVGPNGHASMDEEPGFELITCGAELGPRPEVTRGKPLDKWEEFLDAEGRVEDPERIKAIVFRGGIHSIAEERGVEVPAGLSTHGTAPPRSGRHSEEPRQRDVNRTDRHNTFFSGNDNPGLTLLHDVLMTYCMYNFDLGYVQGMSDLLAPLLFVTQNEHHNFEESQEAMKQQLLQLSILLKALDPELCDYLASPRLAVLGDAAELRGTCF
ncbi:hypothetical protein CRUP_017835 [Coryphaenoides rupestris]|nr:hypothetical protein CRUP_017835 [Coryphaenoides rupestris]